MNPRLNYHQLSPAGMKALGGVRAYVGESGLETELVDLVYLRVSLINGCAYCIDSHTRDLVKGGMDAAKVALVPVWHECGKLFSDRERAALRWAETVTHVAETTVPEEEFAAAAKQFGEKELADLTIAIGLMNAYNRLAVSFRSVPAAVKLAAA